MRPHFIIYFYFLIVVSGTYEYEITWLHLFVLNFILQHIKLIGLIKLLKGETEKVLQVENDLSHQCATVQKQRCPIVQISRLVIPLTL